MTCSGRGCRRVLRGSAVACAALWHIVRVTGHQTYLPSLDELVHEAVAGQEDEDAVRHSLRTAREVRTRINADNMCRQPSMCSKASSNSDNAETRLAHLQYAGADGILEGRRARMMESRLH